ncbi:unnamed protein product [Toxocara canis]|uniref:Uncharacterized protein n=1 Tax=Toxocara canis TaxID=6265 RepID=A0A183TVE5_TOXCA|nr:unnamed protein product [Toxocara canis]
MLWPNEHEKTAAVKHEFSANVSDPKNEDMRQNEVGPTHVDGIENLIPPMPADDRFGAVRTADMPAVSKAGGMRHVVYAMEAEKLAVTIFLRISIYNKF